METAVWARMVFIICVYAQREKQTSIHGCSLKCPHILLLISMIKDLDCS